VILADPLEDTVTLDLRHRVIDEMRLVHEASRSGQAPQPVLDHYSDLLKASLQSLTSGLATGTWRVAVYLLGDRESYQRLASLWRGIYSGDESLPQAI